MCDREKGSSLSPSSRSSAETATSGEIIDGASDDDDRKEGNGGGRRGERADLTAARFRAHTHARTHAHARQGARRPARLEGPIYGRDGPAPKKRGEKDDHADVGAVAGGPRRLACRMHIFYAFANATVRLCAKQTGASR